jgi:tagaturonate reductase
VLQFGTGMLLRALCAASIDAANRAGALTGRIVVVQSTPHGNARAINAQDGLFTLVERGMENGAPVERTRLIGAISRALVADAEWEAVRQVAASPDLRVIVSNVTEAGFQRDGGFPARLTDALRARFERLPDGPLLFVIPTELVPDNGPQLATMVDELAGESSFRRWLSTHVQFCSSLVDRITTGAPPADQRAALEAGLGYTDALITVAEPYAFWAIEADPRALRAAFPIDAPASVVFAPDIGFYEERKLRLLNGTHTAVAPLAVLAGVRTVREGVDHPGLGAFLRRLLFDEIIPATSLPVDAAQEFARSVMDRFRNPWLDHEWRVILTNQEAKMRIRVVPLIVAFAQRLGRAPEGLALACAAHLTVQHIAPERLADAALWGARLDDVPGFVDAVNRWLLLLRRDGVAAVLARD